MPPGCRRPAASPPDPHMKGCIFTEQDFREDREREMRAGEFGRADRKALKYFFMGGALPVDYFSVFL